MKKIIAATSDMDWVNTHQINKNSKYSKGHLDPENHKNVMNCTYYIVFEQNYKNVQWWKAKKERIQKQIADNDQNQMKVIFQHSKRVLETFRLVAIKSILTLYNI